MSEVDESYSDNEQSNDGSSKRRQRTRVPNFTEKEKNLLARIVESKMHIVGSKLTDTESCAKKKAAWAAVAEEFNRENYEYKREITSLRRLWDAMKIARRRESGLIGDSSQESTGKDRAPKVPRTKEEIIMVRGVPGVLFETEIEYDSEGTPANEAGRHSNTRRACRQTDRDDNNTGRRRTSPRVPPAAPPVRRTHDYMRREAMLRIKSLEAKKQMELQILKEKLEKEEIKKMAAKVELEAAEAKREAAKLELEYQKNRLRGQVGPANMYYN